LQLIIAIIKPSKLEDVREALQESGVSGISVTDIRGCGRQKGHKEVYRGQEYIVSFNPKVKLEIAVNDDLVDATIETIREKAHTGEIGDGKIFTVEIGRAVRVRTGESGPEVL